MEAVVVVRPQGWEKSGAARPSTRPFPIAFLYWGRRGALPRFTLDLSQAVIARPDTDIHISISYQNELFAHYAWLGDRLLPIDTFDSAAGVVRTAPAIPGRIADIRRQLQQRDIRAVVVLMPHLWTPLLAPQLNRAGIAYIPVVHDATAHAGDITGIANRWLLRYLNHADRIVTLSREVTRALVASGRAPDERIDTLFHPDLSYGSIRSAELDDEAPLRILFFGRILRYKGLPLFLDAIDLLARRGMRVAAGVFGAGDLGNSGKRLRALGVEVANRWIDDGEVPSILARYDVMVLSHTSASQSGVAAAALGAGMPVVTTPVGGLVDQIEHEKTGLIARRVDAEALAEAIGRLAQNRVMLRSMIDEIRRRRGQRSMAAFVDQIVPLARRAAEGIAARPCLNA
jgi:glycosyltransferase involved in cell wall biosynthesis